MNVHEVAVSRDWPVGEEESGEWVDGQDCRRGLLRSHESYRVGNMFIERLADYDFRRQNAILNHQHSRCLPSA